MTTIAYKALCIIPDGQLVSTWATNKARVIYSTEGVNNAPEILYNQDYHLCVFRTINDALYHFNSTEYPIPAADLIKIWKVEGELTTLKPFSALYHLNMGIIQPGCASWPRGTMMMKNVRLIEEIPPQLIIS